ncbi:3-phosphoshikimate 1-carboxyvinyltransferase [Propionicimonas sp.]|uniref:3-phosphoshikimate 1-carboxyvinyltransferase n=1 Tax=Propionicimonas sp. TaxID=1955623 RepID=UPI0039E242CB
MIPWTAPVATAPVRGHLAVPGSKSASARSLVLAALAAGPSVLTGVLDSRDTALMRAGLTALGTGFAERPDGGIAVTPAAALHGGGTVDVGLAGTVLRFLPPVAVLAAEPTRFVGDQAAAARPVAGLLDALAALGATVSEPRALPFSVAGGTSVRGGAVAVDASATSQFVSALLLAGARFADGVTVAHVGASLPSVPHIEMTCTLLRRRGVVVERPAAHTWRVLPGPIAPLDEVVEPDLTNAATLLAAAMVTGGELTTAWPQVSVQAADELLEVLAAFGARVVYRDGAAGRMVTVSAPGGVHGADVDLHDVSELTPAAAALAAVAEGPSRLRGVAHIRGHETDRLAALASGLSGLGPQVAELADGLEIVPRPRHGGPFATHADHRLAHAAALVGLVTPGVELDDVGCTTKTLPDFPGLWTGLLAGDAA